MNIRTIRPESNELSFFPAVKESLGLPAGGQKDEPAKEFLHSCFIAEADGTPIGRAALYLNPHLVVDEKKTACIGNYEFIEDATLSGQFLDHIFQAAKQAGAQYIIGPMNGSTWENYRFSLDHDSPDFFLEPYHQLYYNDQFLAAGFQTIATYSSNKKTTFTYDFPELLAHEEQLIKSGLEIRSIDMDHYGEELEKLYPFVERSFAGNYLYSPVSWQNFRDKYMEAAKIIQPEFVLLAESDNAVVGFIFAYTDLLNSSEKSLVIKTLARDPEDKWKGLGEILGNRVIRTAHQHGYSSHIHAFMKDTNRSVKTSEKFRGDRFKRYALYGKEL